MVAPALLIIFGIGALLVPDLRAEVGTWVVSGVLVLLAVAIVAFGRLGQALLTARQVKFKQWWGYTSHDGTGEHDMREKLGK